MNRPPVPRRVGPRPALAHTSLDPAAALRLAWKILDAEPEELIAANDREALEDAARLTR